jgi:hypothetical protein
MGLNADALTDVTKVRRIPSLKNLPPDEGTNDWLEDTINAYSRAIRHYTGREILPKTPGGNPESTWLERKFPYDGLGFLNLEPFEVREIQELRLYTGTVAAQAFPASDWFAGPEHKTDEGTYLWLATRNLRETSLTIAHESHWHGRWTVGVVGRWGAGVVPPDFEKACRIAVANYVLSPEGFTRRRIGELEADELTEPAGTLGISLPQDSRYLLLPYQRQNARRRFRTRVTA